MWGRGFCPAAGLLPGVFEGRKAAELREIGPVFFSAPSASLRDDPADLSRVTPIFRVAREKIV
jgi:hypothetical protein